MTFSDLKFIFVFLPAALILYWVVPRRRKNLVLLLVSIVFYGMGSWVQVGILALDVFLNFLLSGMFASRYLAPRIRRFWFWFTVLGNAAFLVWYKCRTPMPIGISFYTFQMIAYQVDVYKHKIPRENAILRFATFMFFFPKLQEGPIARYTDMADDLRIHPFSAEDLEEGFRIFVVGLAYKALLADKLGGLWHQLSVVGYGSVSTPFAWLGMGAYTLQLYYDFSGYSLMAVGLGRMFGFKLPSNFLFPYCSTSISEFYRRWHATLGSWFRDYVYIPLGGSRAGMGRTILNLLVVWLLTGFWHGARWNFILWGFSLFVFIAMEKLFLKKWLDRFPLLGHVYVLLIIPLTWMLFANTDFAEMAVFFSRLFSVSAGVNVFAGDWIQYGFKYAPYLLAGCVFLAHWPEEFLLTDEKKYRPATTVFLLIFFWISVYSIHNSANNPFMYLQF